jgi:molecular chaperone GrpE
MTRSWWENEAVLQKFREWLSETADELDALDEAGSRATPVEAAEHGLEESPTGHEPLPEAGLLDVVEALTAMRHELKLQTRSSRGLEEAVQAARQGLDAAIRRFQSVEAREEQSADRARLPLLEALAGLDEALWRGAKAFEATHRQMTEAAPRRLRELLDDEFRRMPKWRRWLVGSWPAHVGRYCAEAMSAVAREEFARLMEGYRLIRDRVGQELETHGLRRVQTVGARVDAHCMTVVELADPAEGPPETVVEVLRPGYVWNNRVIRFAEVRAVPSQRGELEPIADTTAGA